MTTHSEYRTLIVYDHIEALGGAENVTRLLAKNIENSAVLTGWVNQTLPGDLFENVINLGCNYHKARFPSLALAQCFIKGFQLSDSVSAAFFTGVYSPLSLLSSTVRESNMKKLVYFHTFPSFVDISFLELVSQHGLAQATLFKAFTRWYINNLRKAVKLAHVVLSNSEFVRQQFKRLGIDSEVLYPPVDVERFYYSSSRQFFLSTSRLEDNKNMEVILNAFREMPDCNLVVIGGGSLLATYQERYRHCDNIVFTGWKTTDEICDYYAKSYALLYLSEREYFGLSAVEANASGKPVIVPDSGGLTEIVRQDADGIRLSAPVKKADLKKAVRTIMHESECEELVVKRRQNAQRFSIGVFLERVSEYLD